MGFKRGRERARSQSGLSLRLPRVRLVRLFSTKLRQRRTRTLLRSSKTWSRTWMPLAGGGSKPKKAAAKEDDSKGFGSDEKGDAPATKDEGSKGGGCKCSIQ